MEYTHILLLSKGCWTNWKLLDWRYTCVGGSSLSHNIVFVAVCWPKPKFSLPYRFVYWFFLAMNSLSHALLLLFPSPYAVHFLQMDNKKLQFIRRFCCCCDPASSSSTPGSSKVNSQPSQYLCKFHSRLSPSSFGCCCPADRIIIYHALLAIITKQDIVFHNGTKSARVSQTSNQEKPQSVASHFVCGVHRRAPN